MSRRNSREPAPPAEEKEEHDGVREPEEEHVGEEVKMAWSSNTMGPKVEPESEAGAITTAKPQAQPPSEVELLQEEIRGLEDVILDLEAEKNALKMRMREVNYFEKFSKGDCKKWLLSNYEFDRKDTPDLITDIFENYILHNDDVDVLPHQLLIKNSNRAINRRQKLADKKGKLTQFQSSGKGVSSSPSATSGNGNRRPAAASKKRPHPSSEANGQVETTYLGPYIGPKEIEDLYSCKPWKYLVKMWPRPSASDVEDPAVLDEFHKTQDDFLDKNACAIWERNHWLPIKKNLTSKDGEDARLLVTHHSRRKRRQAQLKAGLEKAISRTKRLIKSSVFQATIFGDDTVDNILKRPRLWIPEEGGNLTEQLQRLDKKEPDRNFDL